MKETALRDGFIENQIDYLVFSDIVCNIDGFSKNDQARIPLTYNKLV